MRDDPTSAMQSGHDVSVGVRVQALPAREVRSTRRVVPGRRRRVRGAVAAQGPQVPERAKGLCTRIRYAVEPFVGAVVRGFPTRKSGAGADAGRPGHRRTCRHIWSAPRCKRKSLLG